MSDSIQTNCPLCRRSLIELCPRCEVRHYVPYTIKNAERGLIAKHPFPALSRMDNKTYICSACGSDEARRDFDGEPPIPPEEWPVSEINPFPGYEHD